MKKIVILSLCVLAFASCKNAKKTTNEGVENNTEAQAPIGGDKDEHGCLTAAGYTWSELRQECIKTFEAGQRLNPVDAKEGEAVYSAFAVFNDDKSKLELFLPDQETTVILDRSKDGIYQNSTYKFDEKKLTLLIDGKSAYKGES